MIDERETRNMELLSFAARLAVDEMISAGNKRYFNSALGSFMRKIAQTFQSINYDVKLEKADQNPEYVWSLVKEVKDQIEQAREGRFENERDVLHLFNGVSASYREYVAKRDEIDLELETEMRLGR